jgi:hypothetical protein
MAADVTPLITPGRTAPDPSRSPDRRARDPKSGHSLSLTNRTETSMSAALFHSAHREAHDYGQRGRRGESAAATASCDEG